VLGTGDDHMTELRSTNANGETIQWLYDEQTGRPTEARNLGTPELPQNVQLAAYSYNDDSKKLTEKKRVLLLAHMRAHGVRFGFGCAGPGEIDSFNILGATFRAMSRAVTRLTADLGAGPGEALVLVDGPHRIKGLSLRQEAVVRGDQRSLSIAAASIFAKVVRDRWMEELDRRHPGYGLAVHKGYGTKAHLAALTALGPSPAHRLSFAPVRASVKDREAAQA